MKIIKLNNIIKAIDSYITYYEKRLKYEPEQLNIKQLLHDLVNFRYFKDLLLRNIEEIPDNKKIKK